MLATIDDRNRVYEVEELMNHSNSLKTTSSSFYVYDIDINGKVANASVNVQEALKTPSQAKESMLLDFRSSVYDDFHVPLKRKFKTMECIKCDVAIGDKTLYVYGMTSNSVFSSR